MIDGKTAKMILDALSAQEGGGRRVDLEIIDKAYRKALVRSQLSHTIDPHKATPHSSATVPQRVLIEAIRRSSAEDLRPLADKLNITIKDQPPRKSLCGCCQQRRKGNEVILPVAALTVSAVPTIANSL